MNKLIKLIKKKNRLTFLKNNELLTDLFFFFVFFSYILIALAALYTNIVYWKNRIDTITIVANSFAMLIVVSAILCYFSKYKKYYQYVFIFPFTGYIFFLFLLSNYENPPVCLALLLIIFCFSFTRAKVYSKVLFIGSIFLMHLLIAFMQNKNYLAKYVIYGYKPLQKLVIVFIYSILIIAIIVKEAVRIRNKSGSINQQSLCQLTDKEREIFFLLLQDKTYAQIADEICRSKRTIEFHATNIFKKLDVKNRHELIHSYKENG